MKTYITKQEILQTLKIVIIALILTVGIGSLIAWTGPTATAPNNNVAAPLNISSQAQTKAGALWSNTVVGAGQFCLGTSCITKWPTPTNTNSGISSITAGAGINLSSNPLTTSGTISVNGIAPGKKAQQRIDGWCEIGNAIRIVKEDGTVQCTPVGGTTVGTQSGTVGNGGKAGIPSGYTAGQCKFIVSPNNLSSSDAGAGMRRIETAVNSSGTVTCRSMRENDTGFIDGTCNYLSICTK